MIQNNINIKKKEMETMQRLIQGLYFDVGSDNPLLSKQNHQLISSEWERTLKTPLELYQSTLTIYCPISSHGEFEPVPLVLSVTPDTSTWKIIKMIRKSYNTPINEHSISVYIAKSKIYNIFLGRNDLTIRDMMLGVIYI